MSHAILIGPKPAEGMVLSEYEYSTVLNLIRLNRMEGNKEADVIVSAIRSCTNRIDKYDPVEHQGALTCFLGALMIQIGSSLYGGEEVAALFTNGDRPLVMLREANGDERANCVLALLKLLENGSWFGDFLLYFLPAFLKEPRTPMEVLWKLSERAANFEADVQDAKQMLKDWPELFPEAPKSQEVH